LSQCKLLETLHRGQRISVDADGIPRFEHLGPELKWSCRIRSQFERLAPRAQPTNERSRGFHSPDSVETASGTGASVAKKRATCWSKRYVEPVTLVSPLVPGNAAITT